jgi:hypothetical protein
VGHVRSVAFLFGVALVSSLVVTTVSIGINSANTRQLPFYVCQSVVVEKGPGEGRFPSLAGSNERTCRVTGEPGWVAAFGIAGFFAGGIEGVLAIRRRRRDHGGVMATKAPLAVG